MGMTRVLSISADRSRQGVLSPGSPAFDRQKKYADRFGALDIIGFSLRKDGFTERHEGALHTIPTRSLSRLLYGTNALLIAARLPWPEVISAQDPFETGLLALLMARIFKLPLHIQVHTDFLSSQYAAHSFVNKVRVQIADYVLTRATRIRVVSERIEISLQKKYGTIAPVAILPIFTDVKALQNTVPDALLLERFKKYSHRYLFVGRLEKEKDPCLALSAFAHGASKDACLIVVGSGSEEKYLHALARDLGIAKRVFFEGAQPSRRYFPIADIALVTSEYEGYGLVIVEALAAGKPVLSTDVGVARHMGATVASREGFAQALREWEERGERKGKLMSYPYESFDAYADAYCKDIEACKKED